MGCIHRADGPADVRADGRPCRFAGLAGGQRAATHGLLCRVTRRGTGARIAALDIAFCPVDERRVLAAAARAAAPPIQDFATRHLRKLAKRFAQAGRQLVTLDNVRLHALRILAKKLRYSAEFFAALYDRQKAGLFLDALSEVQDVLGQINDVAVAHRLLDELAALPELSAHQEAVALAKGWIAHGLSRQFTELRKAVQDFNKQDTFWKK